MRDMKWLSHANTTNFTTSDADVMAGNKNMTISLDFNQLLEQDNSGVSHYVVGGRVFYEIFVYGENTIYFITRGFFDQLGYVQPAAPTNTKAIVIGVTVSVAVVVCLAGICYCLKKR